MRIAIAPAGTLGDIRPCAALARGIIKRGHSVVMLVPENGIFICEQYNIPYRTIKINFDSLAEEGKGKRTKSQQIQLMQTIIERQFEELLEPLKGCDMLIGASLQIAGIHLAQYLNIPYYHVYYTTRFLESYDYPPFRFSITSKGQFLNKLMWKFYKKLSDKMVAPIINRYREKLGLPPVLPSSLYTKNILIASDPILDPASNSIKAEYLQTGYWHFPEEECVDLTFLRDLCSKQNLVYFGLGSVTYISSAETIEILEKLASNLNIVFIVPKILTSNIQSISNRIIPIDYIPHLQLFTLMDIVIHHGGAGTTHAAAQCGIPQIILPQMSDQYYWEYRAKMLQIAPSLTRNGKIDFRNLKAGIENILNNPVYKASAKKIHLYENEKSTDIALNYLKT